MSEVQLLSCNSCEVGGVTSGLRNEHKYGYGNGVVPAGRPVGFS